MAYRRHPENVAMDLLMRVTNVAEMENWQHSYSVFLRGQYYNYRVTWDNVELYDRQTGLAVGNACLVFRPDDHLSLPTTDRIVMRVMWIKGDELGFLAQAQPPRYPRPIHYTWRYHFRFDLCWEDRILVWLCGWIAGTIGGQIWTRTLWLQTTEHAFAALVGYVLALFLWDYAHGRV